MNIALDYDLSFERTINNYFQKNSIKSNAKKVWNFSFDVNQDDFVESECKKQDIMKNLEKEFSKITSLKI